MAYKRRRRPKSRLPIIFCAAILTGTVTLYWGLSQIAPLPPPGDAHPIQTYAPVRPASLHSRKRPSYAYSVISGGAYSIPELEAALRSDQVASTHYAVFDRAKLSMTRAGSAKLAYVSYRIGDNLYWTRRPVRIAPGEALISDGSHLARARCGNRISDTPLTPVAPDESAVAALNKIEPDTIERDTMEPMPPEEIPRDRASMLVPEVFPDPVSIGLAQALVFSPGTPTAPLELFPPLRSIENVAGTLETERMILLRPLHPILISNPGTETVPEPSPALLMMATLLGGWAMLGFSGSALRLASRWASRRQPIRAKGQQKHSEERLGDASHK